jgi:hypothetical protein
LGFPINPEKQFAKSVTLFFVDPRKIKIRLLTDFDFSGLINFEPINKN